MGTVARMRLLVVVVLLAWSATALGAAGKVIAPEARAYSAPIEWGATVVGEPRLGSVICIVDEPSSADPEAGEPRRWWMVQLSPSRFAFMRVSDIELWRSTEAEQICKGGIPAAAPRRLAPSTQPGASVGAPRNSGEANPNLPNDEPSETSPFTRPAPVADGKPGRFLPLDPFRTTFTMSVGGAGLNQSSADQHHFAAGGFRFLLSVGLVLFDLVTVTGSGGAVFPSDHASFQQDVMPLLGGSSMNASSTLQIATYSVSAGLRTPPMLLRRLEGQRALIAALFADYGSSLISGKRFIDNCNDCREESLALPSGTFWRAGADLGSLAFSKYDFGLVLTVAYQRYAPGAGLTQEVQVGFTIWVL